MAPYDLAIVMTVDSGEPLRDRTLVVSDEADPTPGTDAIEDERLAEPGGSVLPEPISPEPAAAGGDPMESIRHLTDPSAVDPWSGASADDLFGPTDAVHPDETRGGGLLSNPASWVIVPVVLAASRIYSALNKT